MSKPLICIATLMLISGCLSGQAPPKPEQKAVQDQQPAEPLKPKTIVGQKTQDIGKYDPAAGLKIVEADVQVSNPVTGALEAYGPMVQQISGMAIDQQVNFFHATHGHYPSYEEFMSQIVKNEKNPVRLPVLPGNRHYQYDEENHRLVVVERPEEDGLQE